MTRQFLTLNNLVPVTYTRYSMSTYEYTDYRYYLTNSDPTCFSAVTDTFWSTSCSPSPRCGALEVYGSKYSILGETYYMCVPAYHKVESNPTKFVMYDVTLMLDSKKNLDAEGNIASVVARYPILEVDGIFIPPICGGLVVPTNGHKKLNIKTEINRSSFIRKLGDENLYVATGILMKMPQCDVSKNAFANAFDSQRLDFLSYQDKIDNSSRSGLEYLYSCDNFRPYCLCTNCKLITENCIISPCDYTFEGYKKLNYYFRTQHKHSIPLISNWFHEVVVILSDFLSAISEVVGDLIAVVLSNLFSVFTNLWEKIFEVISISKVFDTLIMIFTSIIGILVSETTVVPLVLGTTVFVYTDRRLLSLLVIIIMIYLFVLVKRDE